MKKLFLYLLLGMLWVSPASADETCIDKNPEIILDLGGSPEPEKIIYATYDSCTKMHDYCGYNGCSLKRYLFWQTEQKLDTSDHLTLLHQTANMLSGPNFLYPRTLVIM